MGSELSCPCTRDTDYLECEETKGNSDIIDLVMKGKLTKEQIIYEYSCSNDTKTSKVCLISTSGIDGFFANRNLLIIETKHEINYYFNKIFLCNFLTQDSIIFIILQYNKGQEDSSNLYSNAQMKGNNKHKQKHNDYSALYKIESINFISNEKEKVKEQLLNDLYSQLKKGYRFYGLICDPIEIKEELSKSFSYVPTKQYNTYKIVYKKSKLTDNLDIQYSIYIHNGKLSNDIITGILSDNKTMTVKSVIKDTSDDTSLLPCYYFIFEGNIITPEYDEIDFLVVKIDKKNSSPDSFIKDIAEKANYESNTQLLSIINDRSCVYLIFKYEMNENDDN